MPKSKICIPAIIYIAGIFIIFGKPYIMDYQGKYSWYIDLLIENQKVFDRKSVKHEMIQRDLLNFERKMSASDIIQCTKIAFPEPTLVEV